MSTLSTAIGFSILAESRVLHGALRLSADLQIGNCVPHVPNHAPTGLMIMSPIVLYIYLLLKG